MAVVWSGEPNYYWLRPLRGSTAGSREGVAAGDDAAGPGEPSAGAAD